MGEIANWQVATAWHGICTWWSNPLKVMDSKIQKRPALQGVAGESRLPNRYALPKCDAVLTLNVCSNLKPLDMPKRIVAIPIVFRDRLEAPVESVQITRR